MNLRPKLNQFKQLRATHPRWFWSGVGILLLPLAVWLGLALWNWNTLGIQGYIEGEFVYVASPIGGRLEKLHVHRGDVIQANQPLFDLEHAVEAQARAEADARLREAEATLKLAQANFTRAQTLLAQQVISQQEYDETEKNFRSAENAAAALNETLAQAEWRLAQKTQLVHADALVHDTYYTVGEWVPEGRPVVALLPPENIRVRFFIPESMLGAVKAGQRLSVSALGLSGKVPGKVSYISSQAEYTPPVIYSLETRAKLVFLVEGSFAPSDAKKLHAGQPVDVRVMLK